MLFSQSARRRNPRGHAPIARLSSGLGIGGIAQTLLTELNRLQYARRFVWLMLFLFIAVPASVYIYPPLRDFVATEDQLVENLTAVAFAITFFGGLVAIVRGEIARHFRPWAWFVVPISLLGLLDELSFGQRIFHLKSYDFGGTGIDAVHDFLLVGYQALTRFAGESPVVAVLLGFVFAALFALIVYWSRRWLIGRFTEVKSRECWVLLACLLALLFISQFLDLEIVPYFPGFAVLIEELAELGAGFALLFMLLTLDDTLRLYPATNDMVRET